MRDHRYLLFLLILLLTAAVSGSGCIGPQKTIEPHYSYLALSNAGYLKHDGFIIGLEKRLRKSISAPETGYPGISVPASFGGVSTSDSLWRINKFDMLTSSRNAIYLTHIFRFDEIPDSYTATQTVPVYNGYSEDRPARFNDKSVTLQLFGEALKQKLSEPGTAENPYTHILLMSMGWNTDQFEAVYRFNTIADSLKWTAATDTVSFRPLVIGITWPSTWLKGSEFWIFRKLGHLFSFYNKANDADEIGFTIVNRLLHEIVLPQKEHYPGLRVVLVGHSFGARLLSRALFSREYLVNASMLTDRKADLFIGLQGAFSAYRFLDDQGGEGSPYADFRESGTPIVLTTSRNDRATQAAFFTSFGAKYTGSFSGWEIACLNRDVFDAVVWRRTDTEYPHRLECTPQTPDEVNTGKGTIYMIDATDIVKERSSIDPYREYTAAHNDILDREMAELIWWACKTFTY